MNGMNSIENIECGRTGNMPSKKDERQGNVIGETSGIYKIQNLVNGKYYIGSSDRVYRRWRHHLTRLRNGTHENPHLQNAWRKYGESAFQFSILKSVDSLHLLEEEQLFLNECKLQTDISYNISYNATAPMKGRTHSPASKRKMSLARTGEQNAMFGKHHSSSTIRKISEARRRQVFTTEHKEKARQSRIKPDIYSFHNVTTDEHFTGTQFEFRRNTGVNPYYLLKGIRHHYCGWMLNPKRSPSPYWQKE